MALLDLLMRWPGLVDPVWVRLSGRLDLVMGVVAPRPNGLLLLVAATTVMLVFQAAALAFHGFGGTLGLTFFNVALF